MTGPLDKITALQEALDELRSADGQLAGIPDWMEELHDEHSVAKAEIDELEAVVEEARRERLEAETVVADSQEKLKHFQEQVSLVRNQREYGALLQEIDQVKDLIRRSEEEGLAALERQDEAQQPLAEKHEAFSGLAERYSEALEQVGEREAGGRRREPRQLKKTIEELREQVPPNVLMRFDRIRERYDGSAMAEVKGLERGRMPKIWHCAACNYRVRPHMVMQIMNEGSIVLCDSCKRILYLERQAAGAAGRVTAEAPEAVGDRYRAVRARLDAACRDAGRSPADVVLVGASKRQPIERLHAACEAGLRVFGENQVQEAEAKRPQMPAECDWHLLGPLQSNKVKKAVRLFSTVHSIDRLKIGRALDREAGDAGVEIDGFLEVNLGDEPSKHGFAARASCPAGRRAGRARAPADRRADGHPAVRAGPGQGARLVRPAARAARRAGRPARVVRASRAGCRWA